MLSVISLYVTCVGKEFKRVEECRQRLPSELIDLLATAISVNTGYTSRIVVSSPAAFDLSGGRGRSWEEGELGEGG